MYEEKDTFADTRALLYIVFSFSEFKIREIYRITTLLFIALLNIQRFFLFKYSFKILRVKVLVVILIIINVKYY